MFRGLPVIVFKRKCHVETPNRRVANGRYEGVMDRQCPIGSTVVAFISLRATVELIS